ncbi:uncharacterized protein [Panulirus ornatus]|uniref:uncharacterized protein n=1 Tax=Panulirus ornatus TaxID=150431 RepID=UPI003A89A64F
MRALLILVAVSYCSAKLVLPYAAPWPLTTAKLITTPEIEGEIKPLALASPYMHPFAHPLATPYAHALATPYAHPYGYMIKPDPALEATEFPFIWTEAKAEEARRRRRDVEVPLPYLHAVPAVAKTTLTTKQLEPVEAATPADTTKLEITTKEHEFSVPAVKYVRPVVNLKPVTYSAISPALFPWG